MLKMQLILVNILFGVTNCIAYTLEYYQKKTAANGQEYHAIVPCALFLSYNLTIDWIVEMIEVYDQTTIIPK